VPDPAHPSDRSRYVTAVLQRYCATLDTPGRARGADRRLAAELYDQGVPIEVVATAFTLATCRRNYRRPGAVPLDPVNSLHYFRPVIAELLRRPLDEAYIDYLNRKLNDLATVTSPSGDGSDADDSP
jgi:hypothetical protein